MTLSVTDLLRLISNCQTINNNTANKEERMYIVYYSRMIQRDNKWFIETGKVSTPKGKLTAIRKKCKVLGLRINAIIPVY